MEDEPFTEEDFRMLDTIFEFASLSHWPYDISDLHRRLKQVMAEVALMHQTHTTMRKEK